MRAEQLGHAVERHLAGQGNRHAARGPQVGKLLPVPRGRFQEARGVVARLRPERSSRGGEQDSGEDLDAEGAGKWVGVSRTGRASSSGTERKLVEIAWRTSRSGRNIPMRRAAASSSVTSAWRKR